MRRLGAALLVLSMVVRVPVAEAALLGSGLADETGAGEVTFQIDPAADPQFVADEIRDNLILSGNAELQSVTVEDGVATVTFSGADPTAAVEASIGDDIASAIGAGLGGEESFAAAGLGGEGGAGGGAVVAGGVLLAAGVGVGIAAAAGAFDDDDDDVELVGSPLQ